MVARARHLKKILIIGIFFTAQTFAADAKKSDANDEIPAPSIYKDLKWSSKKIKGEKLDLNRLYIVGLPERKSFFKYVGGTYYSVSVTAKPPHDAKNNPLTKFSEFFDQEIKRLGYSTDTVSRKMGKTDVLNHS